MATINSLLSSLASSIVDAGERVQDVEGLPEGLSLQQRRYEHIAAVVASSDVRLVPDSAIDELKARLEGWTTALGQEAAAPNSTLAQSLAASDVALLATPPFAAAIPTPETVTSFVRSIDQSVRRTAQLQEDLTEVEGKVANASTEVGSVVERIQQAIESKTAEFDRDAAAVADDFELKSSTIQSQIEDSLSVARQQHESQRDEQKRLFEEALENAQNAANEARENDALKAAELVAAQKSAGDNAIETLERQLAEAADLMGAIGRTGQSVAYGEDAEVEGEQARKWRNYTIWFAAGAAAVLLISVLLRPIAGWLNLSDITEVDDYRFLISRVLLAGALGGLAAYSSRQAAMHRRASRKARNRELALASIGGYLQPLSKEKQEQVLEAFAFLFFAQADEEGRDDPQGDSPVMGAQLFKLLQQLGDTDS